MSQAHLPEWLDLNRLARSAEALTGSVPLAELKRLRPALAADEGQAHLELRVERRQRRYYVTGRVQADLVLNCQRCMQPYREPVDNRFELVAVDSEAEAEALPEELEPLVLDRGRLHPAEVAQDELILAVPVVARHPEQAACAGRAYTDAPPPEEDEHAGERRNPFAVLAQLKRNDSDT